MTEVIGRDQVVVEFVSDMSKISDGLARLRKDAQQTGEAMTKGQGKGKGTDEEERALRDLIGYHLRMTRERNQSIAQTSAARKRALSEEQKARIGSHQRVIREEQSAEKQQMAERIGSHRRKIAWDAAEAKKSAQWEMEAYKLSTRERSRAHADAIAMDRAMTSERIGSHKRRIAWEAAESRKASQWEVEAYRMSTRERSRAHGEALKMANERQAAVERARHWELRAERDNVKERTRAHGVALRMNAQIRRDQSRSEREGTIESRLNRLQTHFGEYERSFRRMNQSVFTGHKSMDAFAIRIDRASLAMWKFTIAAMPLQQLSLYFGAVAAGAGALTMNLIKESAWLEVTTRQFRNMTGSMAEANEKIQWLRDNAPKINYSVKQVMETGRILESAGYDIKSLVYPMADLAAGLNQEGIDIVSATRAFVDGMHGEIRRLKNTFNISQQDIIKFTKATTWESFQSLSAVERQTAMLSAIQEKYPDANKAALASVLGSWSYFKDRLIQLSQDIGKFILPPVQKLVEAGSRLLNFVLSLPPAFKVFTAWGALLTTISAGLVSMGAGTAAAIMQIMGMVQAYRIFKQQSAEQIAMQLELARLENLRLATQMEYFKLTLPARETEVMLTQAQVAAESELAGIRTRVAAAGAGARGPGIRGAVAGAFAGGGASSIMMTLGSVAAALGVASWAIYRFSTSGMRKLDKLVDESRKAADALHEITVVDLPSSFRDIARSAQDVVDAWAKVKTEGVWQWLTVSAPYIEPSGEVKGGLDIGKKLMDAGIGPTTAARMIREAARSAEAQVPREGFVGSGYNALPAEYARGELAYLQSITAEDVFNNQVKIAPALAELLRKGQIEQRVRLLGSMLGQVEAQVAKMDNWAIVLGRLRVMTLEKQADAMREQNALGAEALEREADVVRMAIASEHPAEALARIDRKRFSELSKTVMTQEKALELIESMTDKDSDQLDILRQITGAQQSNLNALWQMDHIKSLALTYDKAGAKARADELEDLKKQTVMVKYLGDAARAQANISFAEPWQKLFEAAGGESGFTRGAMARLLGRRSAGYFGAGLPGRGMEDFAEAIDAQTDYRDAVHKTHRDAIDLIDDEYQKRRALAAENRRYAAELVSDWSIQEQAMRKVGATEDEIALARQRHMVDLAKLAKEATDGRDKVQEVIDKILNAPQEMIARFLSPAAVARYFPGSSLAAMVGQYGGSAPTPQTNVMVQVRVDGIPDNMVRIVDQRVEMTTRSAFRQALPALSG